MVTFIGLYVPEAGLIFSLFKKASVSFLCLSVQNLWSVLLGDIFGETG